MQIPGEPQVNQEHPAVGVDDQVFGPAPHVEDPRSVEASNQLRTVGSLHDPGGRNAHVEHNPAHDRRLGARSGPQTSGDGLHLGQLRHPFSSGGIQTRA